MSVHEQLDTWVNNLPPSFVIDEEARRFVYFMKAEDSAAWAQWLDDIAPALVTQHMRTKIGLRRRTGRRAAALASVLGDRAPGAIGAAALFARQHVSDQTGDGRYVELRQLTKADLLRVAKGHASMIKGHLKSQLLFERLASSLPSDDSVLGDFLTDEQIAAVAAEVEAAAGTK